MNISKMNKTAPKGFPAGKDLPDSDGVPMDNDLHPEQSRKYIIDPLRRWLAESEISAFVGGNSFVYYDYNVKQRRPIFLGPDIYVVMGGRQARQSKWVVWEEGWLMPSLAIELVSPTTEARDRGEKFLIYRDKLQTTDYFLFDTDTGRLEGFHLVNGAYVVAEFLTENLPAEGSHWIACRGIDLWIGVKDQWLRWYDPKSRTLVATDEEMVLLEKARTDSKRRRVEEARARADEASARADEASAQADEARSRADEERARADAERARAELAERDLAALREELRRLKGT